MLGQEFEQLGLSAGCQRNCISQITTDSEMQIHDHFLAKYFTSNQRFCQFQPFEYSNYQTVPMIKEYIVPLVEDDNHNTALTSRC